MSNAIAKDISVNIPEIEIDFVTRVPNILSANIKYSVTINKQINKYLNHGFALECRLFPLFYKKDESQMPRYTPSGDIFLQKKMEVYLI